MRGNEQIHYPIKRWTLPSLFCSVVVFRANSPMRLDCLLTQSIAFRSGKARQGELATPSPCRLHGLVACASGEEIDGCIWRKFKGTEGQFEGTSLTEACNVVKTGGISAGSVSNWLVVAKRSLQCCFFILRCLLLQSLLH